MDALFGIVDERDLSRELLPPRLPDFNPCDFCMRIEKCIWKIRTLLEEFQENIKHEISAIPV
jgi:hypothetical protein